jgi:hypothetical protein
MVDGSEPFYLEPPLNSSTSQNNLLNTPVLEGAPNLVSSSSTNGNNRKIVGNEIIQFHSNDIFDELFNSTGDLKNNEKLLKQEIISPAKHQELNDNSIKNDDLLTNCTTNNSSQDFSLNFNSDDKAALLASSSSNGGIQAP